MTMADLCVVIAQEARRRGLIEALRRYPKLTIGQLYSLVHRGKYAADLGLLTVTELLDPLESAPPLLAPRPGESNRDAVIRVFEARPHVSLSSGFFVRYMGLQRWEAQGLLAELASEGRLERKGKTSGTRYRLASVAGARPR